MYGASRASLAEARSRLDQLARRGGVDMSALSEGLLAVAGLLGRERPLRRALADPATPGEAKAGLLRDLFGDRIPAEGLDLLGRVVRLRWSSAEDLVDAVELLGVQAAFLRELGEETLDDVEDQLFRFGRLVSREPALYIALTDPGVTDDRKIALLRDLLEGRVRPATLRLVELAVITPRGRAIGRALEDFAELAAELRQRRTAVVRVAAPLWEDQVRRLETALSRMYGTRIQLQIEVDPSVQGGVLIQLSDEVIDGSIARRLDSARRQLMR